MTIIQRPFSYLMPAYLFGNSIEVWNRDGDREMVVATVPIGEGIPLHGVRTGARNIRWRPGKRCFTGVDPRRSTVATPRTMSPTATASLSLSPSTA